MISNEAIKLFRDKKLNDWSYLKDYSDKDLEYIFNKLGPEWRNLKTKPYKHQLASLLAGLYNRNFLFFLDMGLGKMLRFDEPVLTPTGWVKIGELKPNDEICTINGDIQKVTGVFFNKKRRMYKIYFTDKTEVIACEDHLWKVNTPTKKMRGQPFIVKSTKELFNEKLTQSKICNTKYFIPVISSVKFDKKEVPIDPYFLGLLLGDGGISSGSIILTSSDKEIIDFAKAIAPKYSCTVKRYHTISYGISTIRGRKNLLMEHLRTLKLFGLKSKDKFIPTNYLFNSESIRIKVLQGLLDTDGYISKEGTIQFYTSSSRLKEDIKFIIQSLGGVCKESSWLPKFIYKGKIKQGQTAFALTINLPEKIIPFKLKRKLQYLKKDKKYNPYRGIKKIEYFGEENGVCISVSSPEKLYIIHDFIVTHNTKGILDILTMDKNWNRGLVLSPNASTVSTWAEEIDKHSNISYIELMGQKEERWSKLLSDKSQLILLNYTGLLVMLTDNIEGKWRANYSRLEEFKNLFDVVIFDEIHLAKNHMSLTFKICKEISKNAKMRYGLTGTPINRDPLSLWSQFYLIDRGETLGPSIGIYRSAYFKAKPGWFGGMEYKFDKQYESNLNKRLTNKSIRYSEKEALDLPEKIFIKVPIELTPEQKSYYNSLRMKELITDYDGLKNTFIKIRQLSSGFLSFKNENGEPVEITFDNPKLDVLIELINSMPEEAKVVLFLDYIRSGDIVCERLKKEKITYERLYGGTKDKPGAKNNFVNNPKCKVFVANIKSGGVSLNLQVANYVIFYELPVSSIDYTQAFKRVHRIGQSNTVFIYSLVAKTTIEEKVEKYLKEGKDIFKALIEGKEKL